MTVAMTTPPPLPPRTPSHPDHLPAYSNSHHDTVDHTPDPRTSSTQSLVPSEPPLYRRKLLIVYIHGFYGNDQSFGSFPAHVHAFLKELLVDTHIIHSKIYPRYKTYKAIEVARDNFSAWLEPHEGVGTDVILVGHSMGGLLAAEVVLMPNTSPYKQQRFKHRILGTVAIDSPFLGLHPGIVVSGIASLFQPSPRSEDQREPQPHGSPNLHAPPGSESSSSFERLSSVDSRIDLTDSETSTRHRQPTDPHFDAPFYNDAPFREQPFVKRLFNFTAKHQQEGLLNAVGRHITSHLEFGGCLADYRGLNLRYNKLRALEDVDEVKALTAGYPASAQARVRFVNYYTLSPGRPKPVKVEDEKTHEGQAVPDLEALRLAEVDADDMRGVSQCAEGGETTNMLDQEVKGAAEVEGKPALQDDELAEGASEYCEQVQQVDQDEITLEATVDASGDEPDNHHMSMLQLDPIPIAEDEAHEFRSEPPPTWDLDLPAIPELPDKPTLPDLEEGTMDKDARKQFEKEAKRLEKAYAQAVKDRAKAIQERDKIMEKRRKKAAKEEEKQAKEAEKARMKQSREEEAKKKQRAREEAKAREAVIAQELHDGQDGERPRKLKKFCALPGKRDGARDATWVDIYMDGMDEVGAHCGLFLAGPHYEKFVGDVGSRIATWVGDELTKRAILEAGVADVTGVTSVGERG